MEIQTYFDKKKELYRILNQYIEMENDFEDDFRDLLNKYEEQKIKEDRNELRLFLRLLSRIQNNHHRCPDFMNKIQQIILHIKNDITQKLSNSEIYSIFKSDKSIVLFLIKQHIINVDKSITDLIIKESHQQFPNFINKKEEKVPIRYLHYFYPEIKPFLSADEIEMYDEELFECSSEIFDNFEVKRQIGQNDSDICEIIRNDCIDDFVQYIYKNNISVDGEIKPSIFETNTFIISKERTTIAEYAAFFGSINILQYLYHNDCTMEPSIWLYSIHSQNPVIIGFLEDKEIKQPATLSLLIESLKCHHNEMANYFIPKIDDFQEFQQTNQYKSNLVYYAFRYSNYEFMPSKYSNIKYILHYACKYSYPILVNFLLNNFKVDVNEVVLVKQKTLQMPETPINVASKKKNIEIVDILLKSPEIEIGDYALKGLDNITQITIPSSSKIIGKSAFEDCTSLTQVVIPSSVTKIDDRAFYNCIALKEIEIPSSVTSLGSNQYYSTFQNCTSLEKVVIHSNQITEFPYYCFDNCISLKEINIPTSVKVLDKNLFAGCRSLSQLPIHSSITAIENYAFIKCSLLKKLDLPPSVRKISNNAFASCDSLVDVVINSPSIELDSDCFSCCKSLKNVIFNNASAFQIGSMVFKSCTALENFQIHISQAVIYQNDNPPSFVNSIYQYAFYQCTSLVEFVIPPSVELISNSAFREMSSLAEISIPSSVKKIEPLAFASCTNLSKVTFESPCSLTEIDSSIFDSCTSLKEFTVPSSVKKIRNYVFYRCSSLQKVTFENPCNVKLIGCCNFRDCSSLLEFEIPPSVTEIGEMTFKNCSSLSKLIIHPSLKIIKSDTFKGCTSLTSISLPASIDITNLGIEPNIKIVQI